MDDDFAAFYRDAYHGAVRLAAKFRRRGGVTLCPDRGFVAGVAGSLVAFEGLVGGLDIALPPVRLAS